MKKIFADFSSTEQQPTVLSLYSDIFPRINSQRNELYLSSPMTSGGARRLFDTSLLSEEEKITASITHNRVLSETFLYHAAQLLTEAVIASPFHFSQKSGWSQYDYNLFWMYYISGISVEDAQIFDTSNIVSSLRKQHLGADHSGIKEIYMSLIEAFIDHTKNLIQTNPVSRIIFFPDHTVSLGCFLEKNLANKLGIPTFEVACNLSHSNSDELCAIAPWVTECEQCVHDENAQELFILRHIEKV